MSNTADMAVQFDSSQLLDDPEALRKRAKDDGFLFCKSLIPAAEVLELRRQVLELVDEAALLADDSELMDGIADVEQSREKTGFSASCGTKELYAAVQSLPLFHSMAHHPNLLALYRALFEEDVLVHPRHIMRLMFPSKDSAPTPPHQDFVYINGTRRTWTCWIPIGDCPMSMGNLAVLRGSNSADVLPVKTGKGAGGLQSMLDGVSGEWIHFNYEAGDVVTFPSLTVHKSIPTQMPDRIRLSLDYRYQPQSEPVHVSSLKPHLNVLTWEEIYRNWPETSVKYFWKSLDLKPTKQTWLEEHPETIIREE